jgi:hypothetical protein
MNLPDNTTDRLLAVADQIETDPESWDQYTFFADHERDLDDDTQHPHEIAGRTPGCGTKACIAGWGVVFNPQWEKLLGETWDKAGSMSLGLDRYFADILFDADLKGDPTDVADLLRHIAKVPEGERTLEAVEEILPDRLIEVLRTSEEHPEHDWGNDDE